MGMSAYLKGLVLAATLKNEPFSIGEIFLSLHSAVPDMQGGGEVNRGNYKRQRISEWTVTENDGYRNTRLVDFANMPPGIIMGVGLWDAATGGHFLWGGGVREAKIVNDNSIFRFPVEHLRVDLLDRRLCLL